MGSGFGVVYSQEFMAALTGAFDRNRQAGTSPTSFLGLAKAMVRDRLPEGQEPTHREIDNQRGLLRRYVAGTRTPSGPTLERIARCLRVPVADLPRPPSAESLRERVERLEQENQSLREALRREAQS